VEASVGSASENATVVLVGLNIFSNCVIQAKIAATCGATDANKNKQ
jgi:hypothetical protein